MFFIKKKQKNPGGLFFFEKTRIFLNPDQCSCCFVNVCNLLRWWVEHHFQYCFLFHWLILFLHVISQTWRCLLNTQTMSKSLLFTHRKSKC